MKTIDFYSNEELKFLKKAVGLPREQRDEIIAQFYLNFPEKKKTRTVDALHQKILQMGKDKSLSRSKGIVSSKGSASPENVTVTGRQFKVPYKKITISDGFLVFHL